MSEAAFQTFLWSITAMSLVGTALNVKKRISYFYVWTAVNAAWIGVDVYQHLWARMALDIVHLAFAAWGVVSWRRQARCNGPGEETS